MMLNIQMLWLGEYRFGVVIVAVEQLEGFSVGIKQDNLCHKECRHSLPLTF